MTDRRFADMMAGDPAEVMLDEASLMLSSALQHQLDEIEWLAALDQFAGDCPTPTADGVARYLFDELGFAGNRTTYYDWRNSCLDRVIATRTGIPISLSILFIEVARRVGVPLVGVGMPAHFLVRPAADDSVFFDPFHGSGRLDRAAARSVFEAVTQGQVPWNESHLAATSNRDIVIRMLNNLKSVFARRSDGVRFAIVMQLRSCVPELGAAEADEITASSAVFN
jgi:regulator of sirC expression with transglutaminase-like and TPR domain